MKRTKSYATDVSLAAILTHKLAIKATSTIKYNTEFSTTDIDCNELYSSLNIWNSTQRKKFCHY